MHYRDGFLTPKTRWEMCLIRNFCFRPNLSAMGGTDNLFEVARECRPLSVGVLSLNVLEKFCHSSDPLPAAGDGDKGMLQSATKDSAVSCEWNVK